MGRNVLTKTYLMTIISSMFISNALAGNGNFLGSWTGFSGAGEGIAGVVNAALWYDINTLPQALIFVAVFGGIYFVTIKIIHMVFHYIIGAINLGTTSKYSARGSDDGPSTAEKGASAAIAFVATQYAGLVLGSAFFIMALFSTLIIMIAFIRLFQAFRTGSSEMSVGSNGDSGGFINVDLSLGGDDNPDQNTEDAEQEIEEGEEEEGTSESEAEEAEERENAGDEENADREARDAAQHLENALEAFAAAEGDIKEILDKDLEQMNRTLEELQDNLATVEEEEELIQKIGRFPGTLNNRLQMISEKAKRGDSGAWDDISERDLLWLGFGDEGPTLLDLNRETQEISKAFNKLKEEMVHEKEDEDSEGKELTAEVKELMAAHKLIRRLEEDVELARHIDEDELDVLAEQIKDKKLHEIVGYEEEEESKLLDDLKNLVSEEEKIEEYLQKADQILAKIMEIDREEIQEIRAEEGNLSEALTSLRSLREQIKSTTGNLDMSIDVPSGPDNLNLKGFLDGFEEQIVSVESDVDNLLDMKSANEEEIEEIRSYVEEALEALES